MREVHPSAEWIDLVPAVTAKRELPFLLRPYSLSDFAGGKMDSKMEDAEDGDGGRS